MRYNTFCVRVVSIAVHLVKEFSTLLLTAGFLLSLWIYKACWEIKTLRI